jgi:hypothetical protein
MKQIKIINRIPSPADQIDKEVDKLFNTKLSVFLGYAFPCICFVGWAAILCSILFLNL